LFSKRNVYQLAICLVFFFQLYSSVSCQNKSLFQNRYQVEAAQIFKIPVLITWPKSKPEIYDTTQPFIIGIIGKSRISQFLINCSKTEKIKDKHVIVKSIHDISEINSCQILFVGENEISRLSCIVDQAIKYSVLTISDCNGFGEKGILINFYIDENSCVRFEINLYQLKLTEFDFSSHLLECAKLIYLKRDGK